MDLITTQFRTGQGWSNPLPTALDSARTLVLAFASPAFGERHEALRDLAAGFGRSVVMGCSTSGEISGSTVTDDSISLAVARFAHTGLRRAITPVDGAADSFDAGTRLAAVLAPPQAEGALRAVFVLSDGLGVNGSRLVAGLVQNLPADVIVTGGLAGDGSRFAHTWVLDDDRPAERRVCAVGFYGERLRVGHGCEGGWSDFGPERRITRAVGNVLYELDGKPALDLYKTYLGDRADGLPGTALLFPLAVRRDAPGADTLVRTILAVDEAAKTMTFAGDLPEGGLARLMRANTDKLVCSAGQAARSAAAGVAGVDDALVVSVSCVGRRLVLGERTDEEVETVQDSTPARSAHVGFYSYGEISPALADGASALHNQTMTVTVFSEV